MFKKILIVAALCFALTAQPAYAHGHHGENGMWVGGGIAIGLLGTAIIASQMRQPNVVYVPSAPTTVYVTPAPSCQPFTQYVYIDGAYRPISHTICYRPEIGQWVVVP